MENPSPQSLLTAVVKLRIFRATHIMHQYIVLVALIRAFLISRRRGCRNCRPHRRFSVID
ncbi:hypothetical protein ACS0TY_007590 [Phlomoides rotata]